MYPSKSDAYWFLFRGTRLVLLPSVIKQKQSEKKKVILISYMWQEVPLITVALMAVAIMKCILHLVYQESVWCWTRVSGPE